MVFRDNLFYVDAVDPTENGVSYVIQMNGEHIIYKAHFPSEPITPGVCILQIGVELLSDATGEPLEIESVKNVKFLSILRPEGNPVRVAVHRIVHEDNTIKAQVDFTENETAVAKMSLICRIAAK